MALIEHYDSIHRYWVMFYRFWFVVWSKVYVIAPYFVSCIVAYPLNFIYRPLYHLIEGFSYRVCLLDVASWAWSSGYCIVESGDDIASLADDRSIAICNHQDSADVTFLMYALASKPGVVENIMWIIAHVFKYVTFGWVSLWHGDFFIKEGAKEAEMERLRKYLENFFVPQNRKWVLFFPEGGFLFKRRAGSYRYAEKENLRQLEHVAYPRLGAFKSIVSVLEKPYTNTKWLIDITMAFQDQQKPVNLVDIILGNKDPEVIHFHYRVFPMSSVPSSKNEDQLQEFLFERFYEKEELLSHFYTTGQFPIAAESKSGFKQLNHVPLKMKTRFVLLMHFAFILYLLFILYLYFRLGLLVRIYFAK